MVGFRLDVQSHFTHSILISTETEMDKVDLVIYYILLI